MKGVCDPQRPSERDCYIRGKQLWSPQKEKDTKQSRFNVNATSVDMSSEGVKVAEAVSCWLNSLTGLNKFKLNISAYFVFTIFCHYLGRFSFEHIYTHTRISCTVLVCNFYIK